MPMRLPTPCAQPGCPALTHERYCPAHKREDYRRQDRDRGTAAERGYDARWRKARAAYLWEHPLCVECERQGRVTPATVVDHVVPHRGDRGAFWDVGNWQGLCKPHHNAKTAKEAFGHGEVGGP